MMLESHNIIFHIYSIFTSSHLTKVQAFVYKIFVEFNDLYLWKSKITTIKNGKIFNINLNQSISHIFPIFFLTNASYLATYIALAIQFRHSFLFWATVKKIWHLFMDCYRTTRRRESTFLPFTSQDFLVLSWSASKGYKAHKSYWVVLNPGPPGPGLGICKTAVNQLQRQMRVISNSKVVLYSDRSCCIS